MLDSVEVADDSTLTLRFRLRRSDFPMSSPISPSCPCISSIPFLVPGCDRPPGMHRQWETGLSGSSPRAQSSVGVLPRTGLSRLTRRTPKLQRFIVVVVDEPTTKLAALTAASWTWLEFSLPMPTSSARSRFSLWVRYPLLLTYGIVSEYEAAPVQRLCDASPRLDTCTRPTRDRGRLPLRFRHPGHGGPVPPVCPAILPIAPWMPSDDSGP